MDFVVDNLFNGNRIRALTVVDNFSRECLAITVDRALRGSNVVATMEHIKSMRRAPKRIQVDNGSFRDECLNLNWFLSLDDAQQKIEAWRVDYNEYRPHQSLNDRTPQEFVTEHQQAEIF